MRAKVRSSWRLELGEAGEGTRAGGRRSGAVEGIATALGLGGLGRSNAG